MRRNVNGGKIDDRLASSRRQGVWIMCQHTQVTTKAKFHHTVNTCTFGAIFHSNRVNIQKAQDTTKLFLFTLYPPSNVKIS